MTAERRRAAQDGDENGFALVFVLLVTTLVMIGTATMLTVTVGNIGPAKQNQDALAAQAAAQSGVQDFVANLNARCATYSIRACSWLNQATPPVVTGSLGTESWTVTAQNASTYLVNDATLRVTSKGSGGGTRGATRTVTADISGKPNVLRYTYFSNYETVGKALLDDYFPARTITIDNQAVADALGKPIGTTITWSGTAQAPTNAYTDDVCNALYYSDPSNPTGLITGRAAARTSRTMLPAGTDFAEDGSTQTLAQKVLGTTTRVTRFAPCEVTFSKGMSFNGPVYSRDALYLSNGEWNSTAGPSFTVPTTEDLPAATTGWTLAPTITAPYRTVDQLGGTPITTSTSTAQLVQSSAVRYSLPTRANAQGTCTYTGPTRVVLSGTTATVTSPQTVATGGTCYPAGGSTGVVAQIPVSSTTITVTSGSGTTSPSFPGLALGANGDVTTYSPSAGDLYVEGSLTSGRLSLVAAHDIVVTGDVKTGSAAPSTNAFGEPSWNPVNAAVDLVATNNVRVYHPVACKSGTATSGYCSNDITGLYTTSQSGIVIQNDGTLRPTHPSLQYCNLTPTADCSTDVTTSNTTREIDAAVFALNGSLMTDNYSRGRALGGLLVKGGVYESHRGPTGQLWEIPTATSTRHNSGYKLQISYLSYQSAGLPFVPVLRGGSITSPWQVVSTSTGGS